EDGLVTYGEAFAAQPFGNELVVLTITGLELRTLLERSLQESASIQVSEGLVARYVEEAGRKRIVELTVDGGALDPKKGVRIATTSFPADRDPTLKNGRDRVTKMGDLAALEVYFAAHPLVSPPKGPRFLRK